MSKQQLSCGKPLCVELFQIEFKKHLILFFIAEWILTPPIKAGLDTSSPTEASQDSTVRGAGSTSRQHYKGKPLLQKCKSVFIINHLGKGNVNLENINWPVALSLRDCLDWWLCCCSGAISRWEGHCCIRTLSEHQAMNSHPPWFLPFMCQQLSLMDNNLDI